MVYNDVLASIMSCRTTSLVWSPSDIAIGSNLEWKCSGNGTALEMELLWKWNRSCVMIEQSGRPATHIKDI